MPDGMWLAARGSSTMVWHSYYMPISIGLKCPSTPSTNCIWWYADVRMVLLQCILQHTWHQSLKLHRDSIFAQLPAISWQFRHIGGPHTEVRHSLLQACQCGARFQNVCMTLLIVFVFLAVLSKHFFSQSTSVFSTLEALALMHYINLRFTLHYIWVGTKYCMQYTVIAMVM